MTPLFNNKEVLLQSIKPNKNIPFKRLLMLLAIIVCLIGLLPGTAAAEEEGKAAVCAECHEDLAKAFNHGAHGVIDAKGLAKMAGAEFSCAACHGDCATHVDDGGEKGNIFAFTAKDTPNDKANRCLACHKDSKADFFSGPHAKASMDCGDCHSIHGKSGEMLLKGHPTKVCHQCHQEVFAQFQLNEKHRVMEGTMGCESCHDPHAPAARERLAGFKQETCFKCHTDKQGPFLYEHESISIEGCTVCHEAHGSPNRHMLINQSVSELCYSCHSHVPGWHSRFTPESNCANCHATIHGSNLSRMFLK